MHSSRMRSARSLTVSRRILCMPPTPQPCMPPHNHAPPVTMHAPWQPCTPPPSNHAPPATTHAPQQPRMPPATMHAPGNHTCPPATMHAPWQPCTPPSNHTSPPSNHARPPCGQTDTCKNITFANFVCGR